MQGEAPQASGDATRDLEPKNKFLAAPISSEVVPTEVAYTPITEEIAPAAATIPVVDEVSPVEDNLPAEKAVEPLPTETAEESLPHAALSETEGTSRMIN